MYIFRIVAVTVTYVTAGESDCQEKIVLADNLQISKF